MKPYYEADGITIYHGDALEVLPILPSADLAIFDPPYNVGKKYDADPTGDQLGGSAYWNFIRAILGDLDATTLVWTPGALNISHALTQTFPWKLERLLGWHKKEYAGDLFHSGPAMCWEPIIWAHRGEKFFNRKYGAWGRDFLIVPSMHGHGIDHPCPKPPEVYRWLIGLFCPEGGTVLDPTCGSGTALMEAKKSNREAVGIERSERYCEIAAKRLAQGVLDLGGAA